MPSTHALAPVLGSISALISGWFLACHILMPHWEMQESVRAGWALCPSAEGREQGGFMVTVCTLECMLLTVLL